MIDKERLHKVLSSLWKNNTAVGSMDYNQALQDVQTAFDLAFEETITNPTPNERMSKERFAEACKAACSDRNYRSHYGHTETRDDYFVDGVQWADEHPVNYSANESLEDAAKNHSVERFRITRNEYLAEKCKWSFISGAKWQRNKTDDALLSEVLPYFMHGGEADEVVAKLDEVLNKNNNKHAE